jgi:hypothetical protein
MGRIHVLDATFFLHELTRYSFGAVLEEFEVRDALESIFYNVKLEQEYY